MDLESLRWKGSALTLLTAEGLSDEEAGIVCDVLIEAELRGRPTHGVYRLKGIVDKLRSSGVRRPVLLEETQTTALRSAHGAP